MTVNTSGLVDVRFFGAHDRAWVPARDCFLYSEKDPNNFRSKRQDILDSMQVISVKVYIPYTFIDITRMLYNTLLANFEIHRLFAPPSYRGGLDSSTVDQWKQHMIIHVNFA